LIIHFLHAGNGSSSTTGNNLDVEAINNALQCGDAVFNADINRLLSKVVSTMPSPAFCLASSTLSEQKRDGVKALLRDCFKTLHTAFIALIPTFSQREKEEEMA
jgi:hypothetical protein